MVALELDQSSRTAGFYELTNTTKNFRSLSDDLQISGALQVKQNE